MPITWLIINLFANFLEVLVTFFLANTVFDRKKLNNISIASILVTITFINHVSDSYIMNDGLRMLFCIAISIIGILSIFRAKFFEVVLLVLASVVFVVIFAELICLLIAYLTLSKHMEELLSFDGFRIFLIIGKNLISLMLYFIFKRYIITYHSLIFKKIKAFLILILSNLLIISIITNTVKNSFNISLSEKVLLVLLFVELVFTILVVIFITRTMNYIKSETEFEMVSREYENQSEYYRQLQNLISELKRQRHDFNNHINCMVGLLAIESYDELHQYLCSLANRVDTINAIVDCGSPVLTALISDKYEIAKKSDINFNLSICILEDIQVNPIDLSIIIGNALDNAIEACQKMNHRVKEIEFKLETKSNYVLIEIVNTYVKALNNNCSTFLTSKVDAENHGFGLKNIKFTVERYGGVMTISEKNECFILGVSILNESLLA